VFSAGTEPAKVVNPKAVEVMKALGIDISNHIPQQVNQYLTESFDYVITVCGHADENCPVFSGKVKHRIHNGFDDPSHVIGTESFVHSEFIRVRDEIKWSFHEFYINEILPQLEK
jgi:arsenate reductase (thioredoxin)